MIKFDRSQEDFYRILFVVSALDPKDYRDHVTYLKCENNVIVGTDSKRLHETRLLYTELPDGYYEIVKKTKTTLIIDKVKELDEAQYPNYSDMLNGKGSGEKIEYKHNDDYKTIELASLLSADIARAMGQTALNFRYVEDIVKSHENYFDVYVKDSDSPVVFKSFAVRACIMPLRGWLL